MAIINRIAEFHGEMTEWRRDIHQHAELSGQEVRTVALVAEHLRALGMEVRTGVGGHGVVGLLKGMLDRFNELWEVSTPAASTGVVGL